MKDTGYWSLCKECAYSHEGACTLPGTMCRPSFRNKPEEKERKCDFESFYKNANDNDCMAYLHCGKYVVPIKLYNMQIERSTDIYPEITLEGRWMAGSSEKDPSITISKVIFNPPATIVFWKDGSKTVVKCQEGDVFDPEKGLAMAFMKKAYGNAGKYCDEVKKWVEPWRKEWCEKILAKHDFARTNVLSAKMLREALERVKIEHPDILERSIKESSSEEETPLCHAMYDGAMEAMKANLDVKKFIEELFPGITAKAESLAKHTIMSTEDAIRRLVNERLKDVEPSLREYYLGQLEPALAKLKETEEKENKEMKRTLTKITTIEITEVYNLEGELAEVYDDGYKRTMSEFYKDKLDVDDVVVTKVQAFVSENDRK